MTNIILHSNAKEIQSIDNFQTRRALPILMGNPKKYKPAQTMRECLKFNSKQMTNKAHRKSLLKRLTFLFLLFTMGSQLTGCAQMGVNKQDIGVVSGGAIGGLVGSRFGEGNGKLWATGIGAVTGALFGGMIGHSMDKTDQLQAQMALEKSCTGQTTSWTNPDNGNHYSVKPIKTYTKTGGQPCREYITNASVGGKHQQVYGTACRQSDGDWRIVS